MKTSASTQKSETVVSKPGARKLSLNKETLRALTTEQLSAVAGGVVITEKGASCGMSCKIACSLGRC